MQRRRAAALAVAAAIASGLTLVGCGGDEPDTDPSSGGPSADSSSPTGSESGSESDDDAATGPELSTAHVTLNLPEQWRPDGDGDSAHPRDDGDPSSITVTDLEVPGGAYPLDRLARDAIDVFGAGKLSVQPTAEIGGVETYHIAGPFGTAIDVDEYGPSVDGVVVSVRFELFTFNSKKQNQEIMDSVLASVEWNL